MKIHEIFCENQRIIYVLFYDVHKENMFTINLEDGREAPSKASTLNMFSRRPAPKSVLKSRGEYLSDESSVESENEEDLVKILPKGYKYRLVK